MKTLDEINRLIAVTETEMAQQEQVSRDRENPSALEACQQSGPQPGRWNVGFVGSDSDTGVWYGYVKVSNREAFSCLVGGSADA